MSLTLLETLAQRQELVDRENAKILGIHQAIAHADGLRHAAAFLDQMVGEAELGGEGKALLDLAAEQLRLLAADYAEKRVLHGG